MVQWQFVSMNTPLFETYADGKAEIAFALNAQQLDLLDQDNMSQHKVDIMLDTGVNEYVWQANLTRSEASFDSETRQLMVVAQIDNPFQSSRERPALKLNQFVRAQIYGKAFNDVYEIPFFSIYFS